MIFVPSVKFTVESVPEPASNFKGTDIPLLASACKVYVSQPVASPQTNWLAPDTGIVEGSFNT